MADETEETTESLSEESDDLYRCRDRTCKHRAKKKWEGPCPRCGIWFNAVKRKDGVDGKNDTLAAIPDEPTVYIPTRIPEFDLVLNGGLVEGSAVYLFGPEGCGKSTLSMMSCASFAAQRKRSLYASSEESKKDIGKIASRLGIPEDHRKLITPLGNVEDYWQIIEACEEKKPHLVVVDSIQTMAREDAGGSEGSTEQVKACVNGFTGYGKRKGTIFLIINQVNADGEIAGPKKAGHAVDTIIELYRYFDEDSYDDEGNVRDDKKNIRGIRSHKNRNGEEGVEALFEMTKNGLKSVRKKGRLLYPVP